MTTRSRLSDYNVTDNLIRQELYREIRAGAEKQAKGWVGYVIQPDEGLMPELIAYRFYGTKELKWVILQVAQLDNIRPSLPVGQTIYLPPPVYLRERIKHYQDKVYR